MRYRLSPREHQIIVHASEGLSDKEIARQLGIATGTVATYWERINLKVGLGSRIKTVIAVLDEDAEMKAQDSLSMVDEFQITERIAGFIDQFSSERQREVIRLLAMRYGLDIRDAEAKIDTEEVESESRTDRKR